MALFPFFRAHWFARSLWMPCPAKKLPISLKVPNLSTHDSAKLKSQLTTTKKIGVHLKMLDKSLSSIQVATFVCAVFKTTIWQGESQFFVSTKPATAACQPTRAYPSPIPQARHTHIRAISYYSNLNVHNQFCCLLWLYYFVVFKFDE